ALARQPEVQRFGGRGRVLRRSGHGYERSADPDAETEQGGVRLLDRSAFRPENGLVLVVAQGDAAGRRRRPAALAGGRTTASGPHRGHRLRAANLTRMCGAMASDSDHSPSTMPPSAQLV